MNYRYILNALQGIFVSIEEMNYRQEKKQYLSGPTSSPTVDEVAALVA